MKSINLQAFGKQNISFYLAIEQQLLPKMAEDLFFLWDLNPAIVVGRHQLIASEVNMGFAKKHQLPVYRRPTGGGAVYADEGCFMFSFLSKNTNREQVFFQYLSQIKNFFLTLGLEVELSGRNDLLFLGKKVSGNAFLTNQYGSILHGTILYNTNLEFLVNALTPDDDKLISKGIKSVRERVINLKDYLNLSMTEVMMQMWSYFSSSQAFLSAADLAGIKKWEAHFLSSAWLNDHQPPYSIRVKKRFAWGLIEAFIDVKRNKIKGLEMVGDFFEKQRITAWTQSFIGSLYSEAAFLDILKQNDIANFIDGANNHDIMDLIWRKE
ncbi:MAG TPA: lipoate protein ligase C-terminal domain-containing protein [Bacilli bacterium]|nr:lipoate protein ligase C-terminal domain-containing protein [Bacilli bacterium]